MFYDLVVRKDFKKSNLEIWSKNEQEKHKNENEEETKTKRENLGTFLKFFYNED